MAVILIVDDEPGVRRLLARYLDGLGHDLLESESADAALQVMSKRPAAVVFCDIQMPGHDGLWLAGEIRRQYPTAAIVLATSVTTVAPCVSMQAGVLAYLVKPFRRESVIEALETAVTWHEVTVAIGPHPDETADQLETLVGIAGVNLRPGRLVACRTRAASFGALRYASPRSLPNIQRGRRE